VIVATRWEPLPVQFVVVGAMTPNPTMEDVLVFQECIQFGMKMSKP